ncbi:MAG: DUF5131 family protein [Syntrophorhabdales bacterium]|jgi:protein gp37
MMSKGSGNGSGNGSGGGGGTMNKVTSIGWSNASWNPLSGCRHGCQFTYCYNTNKANSVMNRFGSRYYDAATKTFQRTKNWQSLQTPSRALYVAVKGEIYPRGFDPTWYPHRLWQPKAVPEPKRVFVADVGDLFGSWIPDDWIQKVIEVMRVCDWHKFFLLTKNPIRYQDWRFPKNVWCGATVTSNQDIQTLQIMQAVPHPNKFLSIEPLFGALTASLKGIRWVAIGAQTGGNPPIPNPIWVDDVVKEARKRHILIYLKENLLRHYRGTVYQQTP